MTPREQAINHRLSAVSAHQEFTLVIKGMDVWLRGHVVPYGAGEARVADRWLFQTSGGGYVCFDTHDVSMIAKDNLISLYHPLEHETLREA